MDDPGFQKGLSDLDEGLDVARPRSAGRRPQSPVASPQSPAGSPASTTPLPEPDAGLPTDRRPPTGSIFPDSALTSGTAPSPPLSRFARAAEARARASESLDSPNALTPAPDARRPLLDLFPPPPAYDRGRARPSTIAGAPPPRVVRSRFALQADTAPQPPAAPLTYEPFYGLSEKPFSLSTDPRFIYHSTSYDRALQELIDALGRGDAVMLLTGETGIGKTTLCRSLGEQLGRRRTVTSFITDSDASLDGVLKTVLVDFGVASREDATRGWLAAATRQELTTAISDFAASLAPLQSSAVIIVDEAQDLSPDVLEPLAALSQVSGADRRVQIILVGQPALPSLLHREPLRALERAVAVRCRLEPLTAEEVIGYVVHRLAVAGTGARVEFDESAFAELYAATCGVPRLVNLVCDGALTRGFEMSASVIDDRLIAGAAANLELLPLRSDTRQFARMAAMTVGFIALMLVGAGAAAWVFRAQLSQLLAR
jgi:type II secretory pathway predicted ATPase ExeA